MRDSGREPPTCDLYMNFSFNISSDPCTSKWNPSTVIIDLVMLSSLKSLLESSESLYMYIVCLHHSWVTSKFCCWTHMMEKYSLYYIVSVPLCLPSFFIVFRVIKNKFLKSVFNQQITLLLLLNGKLIISSDDYRDRDSYSKDKVDFSSSFKAD